MKRITDFLRQFYATVVRAWKILTSSQLVQEFRRELRFIGVKSYLEKRRTSTPSRSGTEPDQCSSQEGDCGQR